MNRCSRTEEQQPSPPWGGRAIDLLWQSFLALTTLKKESLERWTGEKKRARKGIPTMCVDKNESAFLFNNT